MQCVCEKLSANLLASDVFRRHNIRRLAVSPGLKLRQQRMPSAACPGPAWLNRCKFLNHVDFCIAAHYHKNVSSYIIFEVR